MRPLVRWSLRRSIAKNEFSTDQSEQKKLSSSRIMLGLLTKAPWRDVELWIRDLEESTQLGFLKAFAELYFHNQRPQEAKTVAQLWSNLAQDWIKAHPVEARQALKLRRRLNSWGDQTGKAREKVVFGESAIAVMRAANQLDHNWLVEARDAKFALGCMEWAENQKVWPLQSKPAEMNPFFRYSSWQKDLAPRLHMPRDVSRRLLRESKKWDS